MTTDEIKPRPSFVGMNLNAPRQSDAYWSMPWKELRAYRRARADAVREDRSRHV